MKLIKENFDRSVDIERRITKYKGNKLEESFTIKNKSVNKIQEDIDSPKYFTITYLYAKGEDGNQDIYSSMIIKANDEQEAINKFKRKYSDKEVLKPREITKDEMEDLKKRGMSLLEFIDPKIVELAKKYNLIIDEFNDGFNVLGKTSDIDAFYKEYSNLKDLNENVEDQIKEDVVDIEVTEDPNKEADVEVSETETEIENPEEIPASPTTSDAMGVANMLNALIRDEWEAIDGYNSTISSYRAMIDNEYPEADKSIDYSALIKILEDISAEENNHVGMLQKALSLVSPNVSEIKDGEKEAENTIENPESVQIDTTPEESEE